MVPLPLRSDPTPPILIAQTARPTQPVPTLADAPLWTYGLTYSCEHAGQGDVIVTASFNVPGPVVEATATVVPDEKRSGRGRPAPIEPAQSSTPAPARPLLQRSYDFSIRLTDRAGRAG